MLMNIDSMNRLPLKMNCYQTIPLNKKFLTKLKNPDYISSFYLSLQKLYAKSLQK